MGKGVSKRTKKEAVAKKSEEQQPRGKEREA